MVLTLLNYHAFVLAYCLYLVKKGDAGLSLIHYLKGKDFRYADDLDLENFVENRYSSVCTDIFPLRQKTSCTSP